MVIDITIVAYRREFLQLLLLLKSIDRFLNFPVHRINLVTQEEGDEYKRCLLGIVGGFIDAQKFCVNVACQDEILGNVDSQDGWKLQQILKLTCSQRADADFTLLLDTKNHLIKTLDLADLFNGASVLYFRRSERCHLSSVPMGRYLVNSYGLFGLDALDFVDDSPGTITPYVLHNKSVQSMLSRLEREHRVRFVDLFFERDVSEFYTYNAFLRKTGTFDALYEETGIDRVLTLWGDEVSDARCMDAALARIDAGDVAFFGLHKSALNHLKSTDALDAALEARIESIWLRSGLVKRAGCLRALVARNPLDDDLVFDPTQACLRLASLM